MLILQYFFIFQFIDGSEYKFYIYLSEKLKFLKYADGFEISITNNKFRADEV
jgi:hypothetical protein